MNASLEADISKKDMPYSLYFQLKDIDINKLIKATPIKKKNIYGLLSSEVSLDGIGNNQNSIKGKGYISITNANLGPMPILSPMVGHAYGAARKMISDDSDKLHCFNWIKPYSWLSCHIHCNTNWQGLLL